MYGFLHTLFTWAGGAPDALPDGIIVDRQGRGIRLRDLSYVTPRTGIDDVLVDRAANVILLRDGSNIRMRGSNSIPAGAHLDTDGLPILDTNGDYILEPS